MIVEKTKLPGVLILTPKIYADMRGSIMETYNEAVLHAELGVSPKFVQENQAISINSVLRGLHLQRSHPQGKMVRVIDGSIFDVVVDIRKDSSTFGQWVGVELNSTNNKQIWIPEGFAHGFLVLSNVAICQYKLTDYYYPDDQVTIAWDDPTIGIKWPTNLTPILSDKDTNTSITLDDYVQSFLN